MRMQYFRFCRISTQNCRNVTDVLKVKAKEIKFDYFYD